MARRELWSAAVEAAAVVDALMALAGARLAHICAHTSIRGTCVAARAYLLVTGPISTCVHISLHLPPASPRAQTVLAAAHPPPTPPGAALAAEGVMTRPRVLDALPSATLDSSNVAAAASESSNGRQPRGPFFHATQLRHPAGLCGAAGAFVPNDVRLGGGAPRLLLLTGPNMGGKSTLLRQVCLAAVLAQVRCARGARGARGGPARFFAFFLLCVRELARRLRRRGS